jgi:hypothetical protein
MENYEKTEECLFMLLWLEMFLCLVLGASLISGLIIISFIILLFLCCLAIPTGIIWAQYEIEKFGCDKKCH